MRSASRGSPEIPEHGLQRLVARFRRHVHDVPKILFHRRRGAQPVQRLHDEERVAQPAVAVIPVAAAVRRLGYRARDSRDDRARVLERAQLQRDRGADDGVLPLERNRQAVRPRLPVVLRLGQKRVRDRAGESVSSSAPARARRDDRARTRVPRGLHDRRVRREPQRRVGKHETDMVAAVSQRRALRAVFAELAVGGSARAGCLPSAPADERT